MFDGKNILITGGTGSFGQKFAKRILTEYNPKKIIIYSRDEYKHYLMKEKFKEYSKTIRFFIGDVRDRKRLLRAFDGVDIVIHAAALKHVPLMEYNPIEAVKTNIHGAENIIDAAIVQGVQKVVALSTDKAANPVNLYGATKLVSDKLFTAANVLAGGKNSIFNVVRYGNVAGSRGSVVPYFKSIIDKGVEELPITDFRMTRFWITLDEGVDLVFRAINESLGGVVYVSKIPSLKITDLAKAMKPDIKLKEVGIRPGEKLHEAMITAEDSRSTYEYDDHYIIYPNYEKWIYETEPKAGGKLVEDGFKYYSNTNAEWLSVEQLKEHLKKIDIVF